MSLKRKFEDLQHLDEDEEYHSEAEEEEEDDDDGEGVDFAELEDYGHVRNLVHGLMDQRPPPFKKSKASDKPEPVVEKQTDGDRRVLKLLKEPAMWVNDKAHPLATLITDHRQATTKPKTDANVDDENRENNASIINQTAVGNTPNADGDSSFLQPTSSKSRRDYNQDRSVIGSDTSLNLTSGVDNDFSFACSRRKLRRVERKTGYDPNKPSWLEILPDEVTVRIFGFLTKVSLARCARTCKKLQRIAYDETLWKRIDLAGKCLSPGVVGQLLSRGTFILRLARASIAAPIFENQFGVKFNAFQPSKLQYLDLSMISIEAGCLEALISTCVSLKKLSLENCNVTDKVCHYLADQNSNTLETLHLAMVTGLSDAGIVKIISSCQNLTDLNLGWTNLSESVFDQICQLFSEKLRKLNISGHRDTFLDEHVDDLVKRCPNLVELDISDCATLNSPSLETIIENLSLLSNLSTSRCYHIKPFAYLTLNRAYSLKYFNAFGTLTDPALEELKKHLPCVEINKFLFSSIARPTVGIKRTSIWDMRVRDCPTH